MQTTFDWIYTVLFLYFNLPRGGSSLWLEWWNYEGISGPNFWGKMNPDWYLCSKGKNQSPINIDPAILLFDPTLRNIAIEGDEVSGMLINNGFDITLEINDSVTATNLSLGPLSYTYRIKQIKLHFGSMNGAGSEHTVNGTSFDGELHIIGYNRDVYSNLTHAQNSPRGIAILSAFLQVTTDMVHEEFQLITNLTQQVLYKGQRTRLKSLRLKKLLPNMKTYITYEGSFTQPGCYETVTWILINRPIKINETQIEELRFLRQGDIHHPQAFMHDNRRPQLPLNRRAIRTNINFQGKGGKRCTMATDMQFEVNKKYKGAKK